MRQPNDWVNNFGLTQMGNSPSVSMETQVVADDLEIQLLGSLDLRYQMVPDYDDKENVVTGWNYDQFLYLIAFDKLPQEWLNAGMWIECFTRDIRKACKQDSYRIVDRGSQLSSGGFDLYYVLISYILRGEQDPVLQLVAHLTNQRKAYSAIATSVSEAGNDKLLTEVLSVLKTSRTSASNVISLNIKREDRYVGDWLGSYIDDLGRDIEVGFRLMPDLSFICNEVIGGEMGCIYSGVWSVNDNIINWHYLFGKPTAQPVKSTEVDEIRSFTGDTLLLVSHGSGRELKLRKVTKANY